MSEKRILIAHNQPVLPADHPDAASEHDILTTVETVRKALADRDFDIQVVGYARHPQLLLDAVASFQPRAIFNLFEGEADRTETEISNAALMEWLDIPFTGSPSWAIAVGRDKIRAKQLLLGAGLPTAAFQHVHTEAVPEWPHAWPAIVKPACQDSSVGIEQGSVVQSQPELIARVRHVLATYGGPVLIEQYIPGREFHINLFERNASTDLIVVPFGEVRFEFPAGDAKWPIYSYQAKWNEKSNEYETAHIDSRVQLSGGLGPKLEEVCRAAYRALGLRDYGRIDLRVTPKGDPYILEVNPNPYLESPILVDGIESLGIKLPEFLREMAFNALGRSKLEK
jgi:D-alanine-D-alanine ligase